MYLKMKTIKSTKDYLANIAGIKKLIKENTNIVIGAGAGLSTSAGHLYDGKRFKDNFSDFIDKYGFTDMYTASFYNFETPEEYWAYWSRQIYLNRYKTPPGKPYEDLYNLIKDKNYFVITTNVDHLFQRSGFNKDRLFYTQGDYGLWQCSVPCTNITYDNKKQVYEMIREQENMKIPTSLIPKCPNCGAPLTMNLRADSKFVEDEGWHKASKRYRDFLSSNSPLLFIELGVGANTPGIIKYPFWKYIMDNKDNHLVTINLYDTSFPYEIDDRTIGINKDIGEVLNDLLTF